MKDSCRNNWRRKQKEAKTEDDEEVAFRAKTEELEKAQG